MPLSEVKQIQTPDPNGVAILLRGANQSFNNAFDAANGILGQYQEGQAAKADADFINSVMGVKDENDLNTLLASGDHLANPYMSPGMREAALALRDTALGYTSTRINQSNAVDANSRANANESRVQADWLYGNQVRDAGAAMGPALINALTGGMTYGRPAAPQNGGPAVPQGPTIFSSVEKQYNLPAGYLARTAQIESSNNPNARNESSGAAGLFQFIPSTAKEYGLSNPYDPTSSTDAAGRLGSNNAEVLRTRLGREPTGAELYLAHQQGAGGASALLANPNARAVDIVGAEAVRLNGGSANMTAGQFANLWMSKYNGTDPNAGGATPGPTGYSGGQYNAYMQTPYMQAALDAMRKNPYLQPEQIGTLLAGLDGATRSGQDVINARNAEEQALLIAGAQNAAILDPTIITDPQRQAAMLMAPGLNPISAQTAASGINGTAGALGTPAVVNDPATQILADSAKDRVKTAFETDPSQKLIRILEPYKAAEDPIAELLNYANDNNNMLATDTEDNRQTRDAIQAMADEAGVSVPEMVATLSDMTDGNKSGLGFFGTPESLNSLIGGYIGGSFSNGNITGERNPITEAQRRYGPGANKERETAAAGAARTAADIDTAMSQVQKLETQIQKAMLVNPKDPQIPVWQSQKEALIRGLNQTGSKSDTISQKLLLLPNGSGEAKAMASELVTQMVKDGYPASDIQAVKAKYGLP